MTPLFHKEKSAARTQPAVEVSCTLRAPRALHLSGSPCTLRRANQSCKSSRPDQLPPLNLAPEEPSRAWHHRSPDQSRREAVKNRCKSHLRSHNRACRFHPHQQPWSGGQGTPRTSSDLSQRPELLGMAGRHQMSYGCCLRTGHSRSCLLSDRSLVHMLDMQFHSSCMTFRCTVCRLSRSLSICRKIQARKDVARTPLESILQRIRD